MQKVKSVPKAQAKPKLGKRKEMESGKEEEKVEAKR
jgi:hypothetical protein